MGNVSVQLGANAQKASKNEHVLPSSSFAKWRVGPKERHKVSKAMKSVVEHHVRPAYLVVELELQVEVLFVHALSSHV